MNMRTGEIVTELHPEFQEMQGRGELVSLGEMNQSSAKELKKRLKKSRYEAKKKNKKKCNNKRKVRR